MSIRPASAQAPADRHGPAWVEAIDQDRVFLATSDGIACFLRRNLPAGWKLWLDAADGRRALARLINHDGSPAGTPFDAVKRLAWPADPHPAPPHGGAAGSAPRAASAAQA